VKLVLLANKLQDKAGRMLKKVVSGLEEKKNDSICRVLRERWALHALHVSSGVSRESK
jgi:hypothetical protein